MEDLIPNKPHLPKVPKLAILIIVLAIPWFLNLRATVGIIVAPIWAWSNPDKVETQAATVTEPEATTTEAPDVF